MSAPVVDISGQRIGMLTVLHQVDRPEERKRKESYWLCRCDCGREVVIGKDALRTIKRDCGCQSKARREAHMDRMHKAAALKRKMQQPREVRKTTDLSGIRTLTLRTAVCPVCKREFEVLSTQWAYKRTTIRRQHQATVYYCSWRCLRRA